MSRNTYSIPVAYACPLGIAEPVPIMGTGPTIELAAEKACKENGLHRTNVDIQVYEFPYKGIFGIGKREARVAVLKRPPFHAFTVRSTINGWKHEDDSTTIKRGRHSIYAHEFTKGTKRVFVINESEYESVGCIAFTAFSNDKEALQEFLNDFGEKGTIVADTTVQQTI